MNHTGNWAATDAASVLIAAGRRVTVDLQHHGGDPVFLAFGTDPVVGEGIALSRSFPMFSIRDHRAGLEVRGICESGKSATGGFATA